MKKLLTLLSIIFLTEMLFANQEFDQLMESANSGDADACYDISLCYQYGYLDIESDNEQALFWAHKAAKLGVTDAMVDIGIYHLYFDDDWKTAKKYFDKAAKKNNAHAYYMLGYCYSNGINVKKNIKKGIKNLEKAGSLDYAAANYQLGVIYYAGIDLKKDDEKAFNYYLKAAEGNNAVAQSQVGYMYERGIGTAVDRKASFEWNKKAALQEDARGMISYGYELAVGEIVEQDFDTGISYMLHAAEIGNNKEKASVYNILQVIYKEGRIVEQDIDKAYEYHLKCVDLGIEFVNLFEDMSEEYSEDSFKEKDFD